VNVLKPHLRTTVFTLISQGISHREIHRLTGIDRKTIRFYAKSLPTEAAADDSISSTPATGFSSGKGGGADRRPFGLRTAPGMDRGAGAARA
jgi:hypothetical protein